MELEKLSAQYYKPSLRKEPSEFVKFMQISLIVLICSLVSLIINYVIVSTYGYIKFFFFMLILSSVVFICALIISAVSIFMSKQHRKSLFLSLICYVIVACIIICLISVVTLVFDEVVKLIIDSKGQIDQEQLTSAIKVPKGFAIVIIILEFLFNFSMLISFNLKDVRENSSAYVGVIVYIIITVANIFFVIFNATLPALLNVLLPVAWVVCLYFALEDRTVDVPCVIHIDENGEEIQDTEQQLNAKKNNEIRIRLNKIILKIAMIIALATIGVACAIFTFNLNDNFAWITLTIAVILIALFGVAGFYYSSGSKYKWLDILGCVSLITGLILQPLLYLLLKFISSGLIVALGLSSAVLFTFGAVVFFFLYGYNKDRSFVLQILLFVIYAIVCLYYVLSIFFTDNLVIQLSFVLPILFAVSVITTTIVYFMQTKRAIVKCDNK